MNENIHNFIGMKWKHSQMVWNKVETLTTCLELNGSIHKKYRMKWKHSKLVWNEMETITTCLG